MKHFTSIAFAAALTAGAFGGAVASASERPDLNPQPLPPICALLRTGGNPLTIVRAFVVRYLVLPVAPTHPVCPPIV